MLSHPASRCRENGRLSDLALLWESEESLVSGFHGETLLKLGLNQFNLEKGRCFRLAWPTGRKSVGNGTSTGMVGIGKDTSKTAGFLRSQF